VTYHSVRGDNLGKGTFRMYPSLRVPTAQLNDRNTKSMTDAMEAVQQSSSMADDDSKDYTRVTATGLAATNITNNASNNKTHSYKMLPPWKVSAARREARKAMIDDIQENAQVKTNSHSRLKKKKDDVVIKEGEVRRNEALSDPRHCGVFDGLPGDSSTDGGETNNSSILVDTIEALQRSSSLALASVTSLAFGANTDDDGAIAPATNEVDDGVVHDTVKREIAETSDKVILNDSLETNEATTTIVKPTMSACDQSESAQRSSVCVEYTVADYKQATKRDPRWLLLMARDQISMKKRTLPIVHRSSNNAINMGVKLSKLRNIVKQKSKTLFERKKLTKKMDHQGRTCKDMNVQTEDMSVSSKLTKSTRLSKDNIEVTETELRQHMNRIESEWKSAWPMNPDDDAANHQTNVSVLSVSFDSKDIIVEDNDFINFDYYERTNTTRYCGGFNPNCIGGSLGPILEENSMSFTNGEEEDEEEERNNSFDDDYSSITGTNQMSYDTTYATSMDGTEVELFMCGRNDRNIDGLIIL
jgi:hypothetical protein